MIDKLLRVLHIRADNLVDQPTAKPTRKVGAALWAGALVLVIQYFGYNVFGVEIGDEVAGTAVGILFGLLSFIPGLTAYFTKESGT